VCKFFFDPKRIFPVFWIPEECPKLSDPDVWCKNALAHRFEQIGLNAIKFGLNPNGWCFKQMSRAACPIAQLSAPTLTCVRVHAGICVIYRMYEIFLPPQITLTTWTSCEGFSVPPMLSPSRYSSWFGDSCRDRMLSNAKKLEGATRTILIVRRRKHGLRYFLCLPLNIYMYLYTVIYQFALLYTQRKWSNMCMWFFLQNNFMCIEVRHCISLFQPLQKYPCHGSPKTHLDSLPSFVQFSISLL